MPDKPFDDRWCQWCREARHEVHNTRNQMMWQRILKFGEKARQCCTGSRVDLLSARSIDQWLRIIQVNYSVIEFVAFVLLVSVVMIHFFHIMTILVFHVQAFHYFKMCCYLIAAGEVQFNQHMLSRR